METLFQDLEVLVVVTAIANIVITVCSAFIIYQKIKDIRL